MSDESDPDVRGGSVVWCGCWAGRMDLASAGVSSIDAGLSAERVLPGVDPATADLSVLPAPLLPGSAAIRADEPVGSVRQSLEARVAVSVLSGVDGPPVSGVG